MPPLRRMLDEAPEERWHYVRGFAAECTAGSDASVDRRADGIEAAIARDLPGYRWRENLRELKHYVHRSMLGTAEVEPADSARESARDPASGPAPEGARDAARRRGGESERPPDGRLLEPMALHPGMTLDDWTRYVVTSTYYRLNRNQKATAKVLGINWRTVGQWIDEGLLSRWEAEHARGSEAWPRGRRLQEVQSRL
jgi:transcriptional regulator with AAA-type ATPase domain